MTGNSTPSAFRWPVRVYYEDTDAAGIVYHANYLNFMERARTEWLRRIGYEQDDLARQAGVAFVVRKIVIDYVRPATFNDSIEVVSTVSRLGRVSIEFEQNIVAQDTLLTRGHAKLGCINMTTMRPTAIPKQMYTEISNAAG